MGFSLVEMCGHLFMVVSLVEQGLCGQSSVAVAHGLGSCSFQAPGRWPPSRDMQVLVAP